ncbi:Uu.00g042180.m01.CDS01 [Anthostomella pinea]|uniref:Uu.00g042180.m01.CDS01 n=1 Tax=Anthostomella pinea TaxID=933095 RepID=A0AAI8VAI8_9PEZI|nr:Uu.00g042180.m01.CDS01 [Anthostomella pinea]
MFRRPVLLSQAVRPLRTYGRQTAPLMRRAYADYRFPGKAESLEHSQVFKISQAIQNDHRELERYYKKIVSSDDPDEKLRYQNMLIWELARHSIAEELVVYPAMEKEITDGKSIAEKDHEQHQVVKEELYKFQKLKPGDDEFQPTLDKLWDDLKHHIKEEEESDLVQLEKALSLTGSKELSQKFERTKMFTPTRSHPSAPNRPPFETVAGLMAAPIDKLRDLFTKFPEQETIKVDKTDGAGHGPY